MLFQLALLANGALAHSAPHLVIDLDASANPPPRYAPSSNPGVLTEFDGGLIYRSRMPGTSASSLWWSDGTAEGVVSLSGTDQGKPLLGFEVDGGQAVVMVRVPRQYSRELLGTDGGMASAVSLTTPPDSSGDDMLGEPLLWRGRVWYARHGAPLIAELWSTDGTPEGTLLEEWFQGPVALVDNTDASVWTAGDQLFVSTHIGLHVLPNPGEEPQLLSTVKGAQSSLALQSAIEFREELWFPAFQPSTGVELWRSDGTPGGTGPAFEFVPGTESGAPEFLAADGQRLWLLAVAPGVGRELHAVDAAGSVHLVADLVAGQESIGGGAGALLPDGRLVFAGGPEDSAEPYVSDGTPEGTFALGGLEPGALGSDPRDWTELDNAVLFRSESPAAHGLWRTDGTPSGTVRLDATPPIDQVDAATLVPALGGVWYSAFEPATGSELWQTDGSVSGTGLALDLAFPPINGSSGRSDFGAWVKPSCSRRTYRDSVVSWARRTAQQREPCC